MDSMSKYEKEQFKANKKVVFARKFNTLIEKHDGEENYESFAELLCVDRSTFYNWKFGKVLPGKERRKKIALILGAPEDYFERTDLQDDELISQRHHIKMNMEYALYGDQIGINEHFVQFIRDNREFSDMISNMQVIDVVLNSMDPRVPQTANPYQFTDKAGEKFYLNEYMITVLRVMQTDVEEYINMLLQRYAKIIDSEYNAMQQKGIPWLFGSGKGYFNWRLKFEEEVNNDKGSMF